MGFFDKALEWMGEHKLLTGTLAAGAGFLALSPVAKAAVGHPALPGTKGIKPLPGGGIGTHEGDVVVPPPKAVEQGTALYVNTHDPAPAGNLNARASAKGAVIGYWPKDGALAVIDPGSGDGWVLVHGPGVDAASHPVDLKGWAWSGYLQSRPADPRVATTGSQRTQDEAYAQFQDLFGGED